MSLSDLMMLLFVFFVVLFSFAVKKLGKEDFYRIGKAFGAKIQSPMDQIQVNLFKWVRDHKLLNTIDLVRKEDSLILEIKEKFLFDSGSSQLTQSGLDLIPQILEALHQIPPPYRIGIEGHTDDRPVLQGNWQLSIARALAVHEALHLTPDLESRTVLMGFGPYRPLAPNRNRLGEAIANNQAQNRRVTIRIF